jgi:hypothetical protein
VPTFELRAQTTQHCGCQRLRPALPPPVTEDVATPTVTHTVPVGSPMKVRALRDGFYGLLKRRAGDVFQLSDDTDFSAGWMARVDDTEPLRVTSAPEALRRQHDTDSPMGRVRVVSRPAEDEDTGTTWDWDPWNTNEFDSSQR